jgi:plastocyanin
MSDLHPHWHTVEESAAPSVPASAIAPVATPIIPSQVSAASRRPAAIIGILAMIGIGYAFMQGDGLLGQTSTDSILVRITSEGFEPDIVNAKPGQKIVWHNEDTIPHILYSETLNVKAGELLETSPIFAGANEEITLPADNEGGNFEYASRTKTAFKGAILIEGAASSQSSVDEEETASSSLSNAPVVIPEANEPPAEEVGGIPSNPYTVDSTVSGPLNGQAIPAPLMQQGGYIPSAQPESGPTVWIIAIASLGLLLLASRGAFKA